MLSYVNSSGNSYYRKRYDKRNSQNYFTSFFYPQLFFLLFFIISLLTHIFYITSYLQIERPAISSNIHFLKFCRQRNTNMDIINIEAYFNSEHVRGDKKNMPIDYTGLQIFSQKCPLFGFWLISTNFGSLIPNPKSVFGYLVSILHCCQFLQNTIPQHWKLLTR